jgi:hydroxymethylpyrimidine pyrophosphatase-like HAD family hydrolase
MEYLALACDYDGTLAWHGHVEVETVAALERIRAAGWRLLLVSGRHLDDLRSVFSGLELFELAVLENGALLYRPATNEALGLGPPPPAEFVEAITARGVTPFGVGRGIVATWRPHEIVLEEIIRELGLDWQVILNKDAVMALPRGVNKASGLRRALAELKIPAGSVVGIGDAENDLDFLSACGLGVAVDNALPEVKAQADLVTRGHHGAGVIELIDRLLAGELCQPRSRVSASARDEA